MYPLPGTMQLVTGCIQGGAWAPREVHSQDEETRPPFSPEANKDQHRVEGSSQLQNTLTLREGCKCVMGLPKSKYGAQRAPQMQLKLTVAGKREQCERRPETRQGLVCLPENFLVLRGMRGHRRI